MSYTIENLTRTIQLRGTKAEVGAGSAALEEGALAFATDTSEIGIYTNGAWAWIGGSSSATQDYPQTAMIFMDAFKHSAAVTRVFNANYSYFFAILQNSPADGDYLETSVLLEAGTYDFYVLGATWNNRGKIDWSMGGTNFETAQDWYSAAATYNVIKTATVTIAASGRYLLRGTINGKNASSSSYYYILTAVWLIKQTLSGS